MRRLRWPGVVLALAAAVVLAGGSLAVFTDRETNPQTLAAATSWGTPTPTPTPTPAPEATLKARYKNGTPTQTMDESIYPWLQVVNTGSTPVDLSRVKARYWFTRDAPAGTVFVAECDYAQLGCPNVTRKIAAWSPTRPGADTYLEVGFTSGTLSPGATTGETQLRVHEQGFQTKLDETNDYSWGSNGEYQDWTKVALYYSGTRVWGTEP